MRKLDRIWASLKRFNSAHIYQGKLDSIRPENGGGDAVFIDTRSADKADAQLKCGLRKLGGECVILGLVSTRRMLTVLNEIIEYNLHN